MSRRRLAEILVAGLVLVLLLAVLLVKPTSRRTLPPPVALFRVAPASPPDFSSGAYRALHAPAPDGKREAILYPVEFEIPSELYVMGPGDVARRLVLADSIRASQNPKWVGWLGPRYMAVTLGELYGTVSPGGDVFLVDPESGLASILWASPDSGRSQALTARLEPRGELAVGLAVYDQAMMNERDSTLLLPREILQRAEAIVSRRPVNLAHRIGL